MSIEQRDVLIVGAGFAGLYQLDKLRKLGYDVHAVESAGGGLGGVWYWNCYPPGARVDTWGGPMYQFSDEELWRDWNFSELYPDWSEVRAYFKHVDEKLNLSKDISFNTQVTGAEFNEDTKRWLVHTENTETGERKDISARYFLLCTGFGSKPYIPEIPGLENFKGECYHTARWPQEGIDLAGKRIAVIGTGASGVQVAQESAPPVAEALTVFQRTPMIALPMRQRKLTDEENAKDKETYPPERMARRNHHFAGFDFDFLDKGAADVTPPRSEMPSSSGCGISAASCRGWATSTTSCSTRTATAPSTDSGAMKPASGSHARISGRIWPPTEPPAPPSVSSVRHSSRITSRSTVRTTSAWSTCETTRLTV